MTTAMGPRVSLLGKFSGAQPARDGRPRVRDRDGHAGPDGDARAARRRAADAACSSSLAVAPELTRAELERPALAAKHRASSTRALAARRRDGSPPRCTSTSSLADGTHGLLRRARRGSATLAGGDDFKRALARHDSSPRSSARSATAASRSRRSLEVYVPLRLRGRRAGGRRDRALPGLRARPRPPSTTTPARSTCCSSAASARSGSRSSRSCGAPRARLRHQAHARHAHRAAEPREPVRARRPRDRQRTRVRRARRAAADRPRPLQGGQRHARARSRRHAAARRRPSACSGALRRGDTLARLGGDEFAVLLHDLPDRAAATELGRTPARRRSERPFVVRGVTVQLEASIGVALCPDHGTDVTTLVQRADVAMYEAKREQGRIRLYDPRARSVLPGAARAARRAARRARQRRAGAALPAEDRGRRRRGDRRRGARALAAPAPRPARAGRVPAAGERTA